MKELTKEAYEGCVVDVCQMKGEKDPFTDKKEFSSTYAAQAFDYLASECASAGLSVGKRPRQFTGNKLSSEVKQKDSIVTAPNCPRGQKYTHCMRAKTCDKRDGTQPKGVCIPGCECAPGSFLNDAGRCVRAKHCSRGKGKDHRGHN